MNRNRPLRCRLGWHVFEPVWRSRTGSRWRMLERCTRRGCWAERYHVFTDEPAATPSPTEE